LSRGVFNGQAHIKYALGFETAGILVFLEYNLFYNSFLLLYEFDFTGLPLLFVVLNILGHLQMCSSQIRVAKQNLN